MLAARGIPTRLVPPIYPAHSRVYDNDPRFQETWTKLGVFGLWSDDGEFDRVVLLDGDMLVCGGVDELMGVELDGDTAADADADSGGDGSGLRSRVFAA